MINSLLGTLVVGYGLYLVSETSMFLNYTPIAFDKRVTVWLQRAGSLPCVCMFAALYACVIA